jgi:hypothetical protein
MKWKCADNLDATIPVLAHWRLSSLPHYKGWGINNRLLQNHARHEGQDSPSRDFYLFTGPGNPPAPVGFLFT